MAKASRDWPGEAEELAACFTVHARALFGYACVLSDGDPALASDLVQAAFEAATPVWGTLRGQSAGQCADWLRDAVAAEAGRRTGHPARLAFVSPSHRRLTELKMARFGSEYDAVAGLDRFAGWLRTPAAGHGDQSRENAGPRGIRPASAHARPDAVPAQRTSGPAGHLTNGTSTSTSTSTNGNSRSSPRGSGAADPPGGYGDPVRALYEQHYASLVRLAALLVRDTATAEQIVQDSFVAVAAAQRRRGDTGRRDTADGDTGPADPEGALDFLRQSVLNRSRSARRHGIAPAPAAGCSSASPPLLAALGALPARQREVLVLRYYANMSEEQAADTIGISPAAVRRHADRANAALRTLLDVS